MSDVDYSQAIVSAVETGPNRDAVVPSYAAALVAVFVCGEKVDWGAVNRAILSRWTFSGLEYIKRKARDEAGLE